MTPTTDLSALILPASIVIAGLLVGGGLYFGLAKSGGSVGQGGTQQQANVDIKDVKTDGDPYIGKADAKVVLAYWFDYQCPYCKAVDVGGIPQIPIEPAMPVLIKEYVDTGKLKIVFKDFAFLSEDSTTAALYENAVWNLYPDKFYEWHEAMFRAQDEEHGGFGDEGCDRRTDRVCAACPKKRGVLHLVARRTQEAPFDSSLSAREWERREGIAFYLRIRFQGHPGSAPRYLAGQVSFGCRGRARLRFW